MELKTPAQKKAVIKIAPVAIGQTVSLGCAERYAVSSIDLNAARPALRADMVRRGLDGNIYTAERVLTGRKQPRTIFLIRGASSGIFQSML